MLVVEREDIKKIKKKYPIILHNRFILKGDGKQKHVEEKKICCMTNISYEDVKFDFVYVCEAYEHAINLKGAFEELFRILKKGGKLVIIDKPIDKKGEMEIDEWEQWISDEDINSYAKECGGNVRIEKNISYENRNDGLFRAWIIEKR